jgi:hypothetical protein
MAAGLCVLTTRVEGHRSCDARPDFIAARRICPMRCGQPVGYVHSIIEGTVVTIDDHTSTPSSRLVAETTRWLAQHPFLPATARVINA